ncbi:MAG: DUF2029 domain-containing protein [Clostridia bacterium]|nr:DUF2029 domain-containing protein [Clostridia bacterium]
MGKTDGKFKERASRFFNGIGSFVKKYELAFFAFGFLVIAALMRVSYFDFRSNDYKNFLKGWFEEIKALGGFRGFGSAVGDYTPMYKYIITVMTYFPFEPLYMYKTVSCLFDAITAVFAGLIVRRATKSDVKALTAYAIALFAPSVFLNSAVWAQCDSIFTCFSVISLWLILKDKSHAAMAVYAVSFSFKIQAVFFAPAIAVLILRRKVKLTSLAFFFAAYFLCAVPAMIAGMKFTDALFGAYIKQVGEYSNMTYGAANLYQMLPAGFADEKLLNMFLFFAVGVTCIFCVLLYRGNYPDTDENVILISYLSALILPFVLPKMHERYFYLSDIFGLLFAFCFINKSYIPFATGYCSMRVVVKYLFDPAETKMKYINLSYVMLAAIVLLCLFAYKRLSEGEEKRLLCGEDRPSNSR